MYIYMYILQNDKIKVMLNEHVLEARNIVHKTRSSLQINEAWRPDS